MTPHELLHSMTDAFPPPKSKHHSLTLNGEALLLTIWVGDDAMGFGLDADDFAKPIDKVIDEIRTLLKAKKTPFEALLEATRRDRKA